MSWVAVSIAGASVAGALIGKSATKGAAGEQAGAAQEAAAMQAAQYADTKEMNAPYTAAGGAGVTRLAHLLGIGGTGYNSILEKLRNENPKMAGVPVGFGVYRYADGTTGPAKNKRKYTEGQLQAMAQEQFAQTDPGGDFGALNKRFTMEDFHNDPVTKLSMQFGLDEGEKAINRMAKARGMYNSGAAAKELGRYTTDYVGRTAGQSRDRYVQDQTLDYNRLAGISGTGQTSTQAVGSAGANAATHAGEAIIGAGNARGAAGIAQAGLYSGMVQDLAGAGRRYFMSPGSTNAPLVPEMAPGQYSLVNPQYG